MWSCGGGDDCLTGGGGVPANGHATAGCDSSFGWPLHWTMARVTSDFSVSYYLYRHRYGLIRSGAQNGHTARSASSVMGVPRATLDDRLLYPIHTGPKLILCRLEHTDRRCRLPLDT